MQDADAAFVAVTVGALREAIAEVLAAAPGDCVVSDVGSTKRPIAAEFADPRFVGGHPLAGAETSGVEHARSDLFEGATWYLTPTSSTSGLLYDRLYRLLHGIGARPAAIEPDTHDTVLAAVSHLPHVLANVLVSQAAGTLAAGDERLPATGPSFRDATRVAGAPTKLWTDIYLSNRDALAGQLEETVARLTSFRAMLLSADAERIAEWNEAAANDRRRLLEAQLAGGTLYELRASVPNRPGRDRGAGAGPGPRRRQHHRHGAVSCRRHERRRSRALDCGRGGGNAGARNWSGVSGFRWRAHERALRAVWTAARPPAGPGRQVDLAPRRDHRRDGVGAGALHDYLEAADTPRRSSAIAELGAIVERREERRPDPRLRAAQRPGSGRPDRRRQRGHADAAAARVARVPGRRELHARRRRLDPPPARRPDRRAAAADGGDGSTRARAVSRRSPSTAPRCGDRVRAAGGERAGQVVRAAGRAGDRRRRP